MQRVKVQLLAGTGSSRVVWAGQRWQQVDCDLISHPVLRLPAEVIEGLKLTPNQEINVLVQEQGRRLYLGPLIGLLLGRKGLTRLLETGGERYRQMAAEAGDAGAMFCVFSLEGIDRERGQVHGWVNQGGTWVESWLPLPDVIYNRATYSGRQRRRRARKLLRELVALDGVTLVNGVNALGKWGVHAALRFFAGTAHLTPETSYLTDYAGFAAMLSRHERLFAKADYSSHGADVLRVEATATGWHVRGQCRRRTVDEDFGSLDELFTFLTLLKGRRDWVIQQAVDLPKVEGRIFDLRVIAQKNGQGEWMVPLVLVRWAQPGQIITNTTRGAEPLLPRAFLARVGRARPELGNLEEVATQVAIQTATALEARFGRLGEVGIDIGLDTAGRPWVLEANTKPYHRRLAGLAVPLFRGPIHYAVHLAMRKWMGQETGLEWV